MMFEIAEIPRVSMNRTLRIGSDRVPSTYALLAEQGLHVAQLVPRILRQTPSLHLTRGGIQLDTIAAAPRLAQLGTAAFA